MERQMNELMHTYATLAKLEGVVPPDSNSKYELKFDKRPSSFSALTIWAMPDELYFAINQLQNSKRTYCIEYRPPNNSDDKIRVWTQSFTGCNWYDGK